ncbi:hypothetical protein Tco_0339873 [Tanacetum coccineum]
MPLLKQGEYDTWRLRNESYIQLQDYALWEIIEEGNSFKVVARTTTDEDGTTTTTIPGTVIAEQKILKKNDLKARSILMMTLPSEHLLTFNKHKDANASSSKSLDSIFNRLHKIVSQLTILGEIITPKELNLKFLRSLPTEWGHSSTNDVNTANVHVSTGSTPVSTASTNNSTAYQIHEDDLDEIDLKWQLALLNMKARKFFREDGKELSSMERATGCYMADDDASTNFALMAFSDSEVQNNKTCSKTYLKNYEDLKSKYDKLRIELNKSESDLDSYKKGLASVEKQLVFYKKNESMLCDQIVVLKRDASFNELDINGLKKQGLGYNAVPPPLTGLFAPPSIDLSNLGLEKFKLPELEGYGVKVNKDVSENVSKEVKKNSNALIIEDWVSDCDEDETVVFESLNVQKPKQPDQPRKVSQNPRNNSTSWNTPMPKKLGVGFQFTPKACFVCGSFNHLIKDCDFHDKRMVQKPVLNNVKKGTGQREVRSVWTNAMRVNH